MNELPPDVVRCIAIRVLGLSDDELAAMATLVKSYRRAVKAGRGPDEDAAIRSMVASLAPPLPGDVATLRDLEWWNGVVASTQRESVKRRSATTPVEVFRANLRRAMGQRTVLETARACALSVPTVQLALTSSEVPPAHIVEALEDGMNVPRGGLMREE
jgi:hypothetical protein